MKVELSIEDKLELAKIFKIHRYHLGCTQKEYIKDQQGIPICSISTYSRLENGLPIKSDEIYEILLSVRMHTSFNYGYDIRIRLKKDFQQLYQKIEAYDLMEAKRILHRIIGELNKQEDSIMNTCYLRVLTLIDGCYFHNQTPPAIIAEMLTLFDCYTREILIDLLFKEVLRTGSSMQKINAFANKLQIQTATHSLNYLNRVLLHYYNDEMLSAFMELKPLLRYFETHHLCNRQLDAYNIMLAIYVNVQPQNIPSLLREYQIFIQKYEGELHPEKLRQSLYNQAMICLDIQEEAEALKLLSQMDDHEDDLTLRKTVISCYLRSYLELPEEDFDHVRFSASCNPGALAMLEFYQRKAARVSLSERKAIIQKKVLNRIDPDDEILMDILKEEIVKLAKSSHETYLLQRFQRLRDHHSFEKNSGN